MLTQTRIVAFLFLIFGTILSPLSAQNTEIWDVQGAGVASPLEGQTVTTEANIVTARGSGFFFVQTPNDRSDDDPATSDAILVNAAYFGSVGDVVTITGRVEELDGTTSLGGPSLNITTIDQGAPLPTIITLGPDLPSPDPTDGPHSLEAVENMLVAFDLTATGPSDALELTPVTAADQRPMREPGIHWPGLDGLPVWDGNPEVFWVDPNGLNAPNNRFFNAGDAISGQGVLVEADVDFWVLLPRDYAFTVQSELLPVPAAADDEFTVGSLNVLQLFSGSSNFNLRLDKLARFVVEQMRSPSIVAIQEAGSLSALQSLANRIAQFSPGTTYQAYWQSGEDDIQQGYLVRSNISVTSVAQLGADELFTFGGVLHDRPPLLLHALLPTNPPTPIQVLNLHMRSLIGIEGSTAGFVRNKRHQQAISIAEMVQALRNQGNLVVLGDLNAHEFTDGYVDVYHQIAGSPSLGAQFDPVEGIVSPPLEQPIFDLPPEERYSYVFNGNAQTLDHCLYTNLQFLEYTDFAYARGNADYALALFANPSLPQASSDHDGLVLYLRAENPVAAVHFDPTSAIQISCANPMGAHRNIQVIARSEVLEVAVLTNARGQVVWQNILSGRQAQFRLPSYLSPGTYVLTVRGDTSTKSQRLVL